MLHRAGAIRGTGQTNVATAALGCPRRSLLDRTVSTMFSKRNPFIIVPAKAVPLAENTFEKSARDPFAARILNLSSLDLRIWREFLATPLIPMRQGGGGCTRKIGVAAAKRGGRTRECSCGRKLFRAEIHRGLRAATLCLATEHFAGTHVKMNRGCFQLCNGP